MFSHAKRLLCCTLIALSGLSGLQLAAAEGKDEARSILLAGLQMYVSGDVKNNQKQIMAGIDQAAREGASFLATPEGSLSGYTKQFNQLEVAAALEEVRTAAAKAKVGLMLGTCYNEQVDGKEVYHNQVRVYTPEGAYLGAHRKIMDDNVQHYTEGQLRTFDWNGFRFGVLICNDLWATPGYTTMHNPYLVRKLKNMGAQFIVHCIHSGTLQRYRAFHESSAELWALKTQIPIMEVNAGSRTKAVNAQSGLIDADGQRSIRVPEVGSQFFTVRIYAGGKKQGSRSRP